MEVLCIQFLISQHVPQGGIEAGPCIINTFSLYSSGYFYQLPTVSLCLHTNQYAKANILIFSQGIGHVPYSGKKEKAHQNIELAAKLHQIT